MKDKTTHLYVSGSKAYPSVSKTGGFFIPKIKKGRFNSL